MLPRQRVLRLSTPTSPIFSTSSRRLSACSVPASIRQRRNVAPRLRSSPGSGWPSSLANFSTYNALGKKKEGFFDGAIEPLSEEEKKKANLEKAEAEEKEAAKAKSSSSDAPSNNNNGKSTPESPDGKGSAAGGASSGSA